MPFNERRRSQLPGPGPYLAEITNHLDPTYMGGLEVILLTHVPSKIDKQSNTYPVKYLSPFYGVTSVRFQGNNSADFNDVQKSYGMWMVPPDVGTTVMVIFVNSDPNQGYWIGCVPDIFQNLMVPGIASSSYFEATPAQKEIYGSDITALPIAEFNKKVFKSENPNVDTVGKPIHPFADRLLAQGLLLDTVRGITSSSARRERPSGVFGISTPGPIDTKVNATRGKIGYAGESRAPVSRLGGTTFVMDDGDVNGNNELVRIRTRTGHQILLHNSSDLIYIANSKGTAWLEMTSSGKIDIYAADSISMHTEGDFNFRSDRDVNIEATRNVNIATQGGTMNLTAQQDLNVISNNFNASTIGNYSLSVSNNINIHSDGVSNYGSTGKLSLQSNGLLALGAGSDVSMTGGSSITMTAPIINQNGPKATAPTSASPATPPPLNLFGVPSTSVGAGWPGNHYQSINVKSIMQRIPMHEPWKQHESISSPYSLALTDTTIQASYTTANGGTITGPSSAGTAFPFKAGPGKDQGTVNGVPTPWTTDTLFLDKVKSVAESLGFSPIDLMAIMNVESARTFDPAITNNLGYTGLIQFGNDAAKSLGTTTGYLRGLSRVQQMDWVYQYFHKLWGWPNLKCTNPTLGNLYLTVFLPAFRFYLPDQVVCSLTDPKTSSYYINNPVFDPTHLGYITPTMVGQVAANSKAEVTKCLSVAGLDTNFNKISSS